MSLSDSVISLERMLGFIYGAWMGAEVGADSQMVESVGNFSLVPCSKQPELGSPSPLTKVGFTLKKRLLSKYKESSRARRFSFLVKVVSSRCWGKELSFISPAKYHLVFSQTLYEESYIV